MDSMQKISLKNPIWKSLSMIGQKIFISAAEPSGDLIAAEVMDHLPDASFIGIGGEQMAKRGLVSFFPMSELTVMGFSQVIPRAFSILRRITQTANYILQENPDSILTVDAYSFHSRLVKKLRKLGYKGKIFQYVPPAVWAWKPSRAKSMARLYDHVFCIFPFEPAYFEKEGLLATFVGHPAIYRVTQKDASFRTRFSFPEGVPLITILPGSRRQEITKLLPIYLEAAKLILDSMKAGDLRPRFIIPTFTHFEEEIRSIAAEKNIEITIMTEIADKYACFHESALAIAASGTVALELASYGVPTIIGYITSRLNYWLARSLVTVKYICAVNILADRPIVPELIQNDCTPDIIAKTAISLLGDTASSASSVRKEIASVIEMLHCPLGSLPASSNVTPQEIVARAVRREEGDK